MNHAADDQFLVNTADRLDAVAGNAARPGAAGVGQSPVGLGKVIEVAGNGTYKVQVLGANNSVVAIIPGVLVWGSSVYQVGARVQLFWIPGRRVPFIASGHTGIVSGTPVVVISAGVLTLE